MTPGAEPNRVDPGKVLRMASIDWPEARPDLGWLVAPLVVTYQRLTSAKEQVEFSRAVNFYLGLLPGSVNDERAANLLLPILANTPDPFIIPDLSQTKFVERQESLRKFLLSRPEFVSDYFNNCSWGPESALVALSWIGDFQKVARVVRSQLNEVLSAVEIAGNMAHCYGFAPALLDETNTNFLSSANHAMAFDLFLTEIFKGASRDHYEQASNKLTFIEIAVDELRRYRLDERGALLLSQFPEEDVFFDLVALLFKKSTILVERYIDSEAGLQPLLKFKAFFELRARSRYGEQVSRSPALLMVDPSFDPESEENRSQEFIRRRLINYVNQIRITEYQAANTLILKMISLAEADEGDFETNDFFERLNQILDEVKTSVLDVPEAISKDLQILEADILGVLDEW